MKTLKFECTNELCKDLYDVHGIDIVDRIKNKLLELNQVWEIAPVNADSKLKFTMYPRWVLNDDGSESFTFDIKISYCS